MNRKDFLSVAIPTGMVVSSLKGFASEKVMDPTLRTKFPPILGFNDKIAITAPAGYITIESIQPAISLMQSWGLQVVVGNTIGKKDGSFGGTDAERLADFQRFLNDPSIKAIMCARGGFGFVRIIDQLDFKSFKKQPKWLIGFSDITVLHCHVNRNFEIPTIHSKMCNSFPSDWNTAEPIQIDTINSIKSLLFGEFLNYTAPANPNNVLGNVKGILIGGNLRTIENLTGSMSQINTKNKLLFVEDTGEYLYSIDRMFFNLERAGLLAQLKGLIVGGFKIKPDDEGEEFSKTLYEIVLEKVMKYDFPVCFDFPVGHQRANFALKCGAMHELKITESGTGLHLLE